VVYYTGSHQWFILPPSYITHIFFYPSVIPDYSTFLYKDWTIPVSTTPLLSLATICLILISSNFMIFSTYILFSMQTTLFPQYPNLPRVSSSTKVTDLELKLWTFLTSRSVNRNNTIT
jgi:hypothetical protein